MAEVDTLLETWPTADVAGVSWRDHGWVAIAADDEEAIALADEAARSTSRCRSPRRSCRCTCRGCATTARCSSGSEATVVYGDKAVGTNHVLPTLRGARYTGGLWVGKFLKTCTYQELTQEGTRRVAPAVEAICEAENFAGHGLTATMRLQAARA